MEKLFVYGTLLYNDTHKKLLGKVITDTSFDTLQNYERHIIDEEDGHTSMIYQQEGSHVNGLVLTVYSEELSKIDTYETERYKRICVTLDSGLKAWVYVNPINNK